ncbi:hypothetical protein [Alsobacter soli]|uniref:pPIWI-associating nuclease domain-containing protein n=1 Tax=Alsobacter soli TaxID=2109933 RepID=UPI0011B1CAE6|nr:hypothetical protein [Alsobacter soli]
MPDEFAVHVLNGSIRVAWDAGNPIRTNLFAAGLRELVGYVLHEAAPDEQVRRCSWFREDPNLKAKREAEGRESEPKATRRQRMIYATQGGLPDDLIARLGVDLDATHTRLSKMFENLNRLTHVRPGTRITEDSDVISFMKEALEAVLCFYQTLSACRSEIAEVVAEEVNDEALAALTETVVEELDELSSHTFVDDVVTEVVRIKKVTAEMVSLETEGTVYVTLNYGSKSDFKRADGVTLAHKYPFRLQLTASTADIHRLTPGIPTVDNSSFYE